MNKKLCYVLLCSHVVASLGRDFNKISEYVFFLITFIIYVCSFKPLFAALPIAFAGVVRASQTGLDNDTIAISPPWVFMTVYFSIIVKYVEN